jgi:hypothetical protein
MSPSHTALNAPHPPGFERKFTSLYRTALSALLLGAVLSGSAPAQSVTIDFDGVNEVPNLLPDGFFWGEEGFLLSEPDGPVFAGVYGGQLSQGGTAIPYWWPEVWSWVEVTRLDGGSFDAVSLDMTISNSLCSPFGVSLGSDLGGLVAVTQSGTVTLGGAGWTGITTLVIEVYGEGDWCSAQVTTDDLVVVKNTWSDQGSALAGVAGTPLTTGTGTLAAGSANQVDLSGAAPLATAGLFVALSSTPVPFKGGTLKPFPFLPPLFLTTSASGTIEIPFHMPLGVPAGTDLWVQWAIQDGAAVAGVALSNAIQGVTP